MIAKASVAVSLLKPDSAMILMMCSWSGTPRGNACSAAAISSAEAHLVDAAELGAFAFTDFQESHLSRRFNTHAPR
jgi:hypothetical protein